MTKVSPQASTSASKSDLPIAQCLAKNKVVKKSSSNGHALTDSHSKMDGANTPEEIQLLLSRLSELVPNVPRNKKLSKLEIIQYVIDYIYDLQLALESHPNTKQALQTTPSVSSSSPNSNRQPLTVLSSSPIN
jgi:hypothetical protein